MKCTYNHCIYLYPRACLAGPSELHHPNSLTVGWYIDNPPGTVRVNGKVSLQGSLTARCGAPLKVMLVSQCPWCSMVAG